MRAWMGSAEKRHENQCTIKGLGDGAYTHTVASGAMTHRAAPATTCSTARRLATKSTEARATTSSPAVRAGTPSTAAPATRSTVAPPWTSSTAATATTRSNRDQGRDAIADGGPGHDVAFVNSESARKTRIDREALRDVEEVIEAPEPPPDPTEGVSVQLPDGGGSKPYEGTERNDRINGHDGPNRIFGLAGDDIIWGDAAPGEQGDDYLDGGDGNDGIWGASATTRSS